MRRAMFAAVGLMALLVAGSFAEEEPKASSFRPPDIVAPVTTTVSLVGPSQAKVGQPVWLTLVGVPQTNIADINWGLRPVYDSDQFIQLFDAKGQIVCFFWSDTPGVRTVFCDVNVPGAYKLLLHDLTYGDKADPKPDPIPPPPPPDGERWLLILEESSDRTPQQASVMLSPKLTPIRNANKFRLVDVKRPGGTVPTAYAHLINQLGNLSLPAYFVVAEDNITVIHKAAFPASVDALLKAFVKHGGKVQ